MRIENAHFRNLRNIKDCSLSFSPKANFILGPNGAGKSALLEGYYLMSRGKTFRGGSLESLINKDGESVSIRVKVEGDSGVSRELALEKKRREKSGVRLDTAACGLADVGRLLPVQLITPNSTGLVYLGPEVRRSFLDWGLFHVEHGYLELARSYKKTLRQRNAWLKSSVGVEDPWVSKLSELGAKINEFRRIYLERLRPAFEQIDSSFSEVGPLGLEYLGGGYGSEPAEALTLLNEAWRSDSKRGSTSIGPHTAEMKITLGGYPAKAICSRGQSKLLAFYLGVSQALDLRASKQKGSVLLLDDIGSELDQDALIECLELVNEINMQSFITTTQTALSRRLLDVFGQHSVFHVKQGEFLKENFYGD